MTPHMESRHLDSADVNPFVFWLLRRVGDPVIDFIIAIPAPVWGAGGVVAAAVLTTTGVIVGHIIGAKSKGKADAGTLALGMVTELQDQITGLNVRVTQLETERNAYRSWSHELFDWGAIAQTDENPRPSWPSHLPR